MPLKDLLSADRIAILTEPGDHLAVLDAASRLLAGNLPAAADTGFSSAGLTEAIGESLRNRERLASTAIGHGVAIPHGRLPTIEESRGAFLRLAEPVDFGAADGQPVDLVVAMAVPEHYVQQHLQQLAEVAERFASPKFRARLRAAADVAELRCALLDGAYADPERT
ncbi:MAG: PTS sugar transporter subunit IIA [Proteobacteria bacterium]|nr:PTS sugar transporter subunit IIA [Pseudomonadota bacterium]